MDRQKEEQIKAFREKYEPLTDIELIEISKRPSTPHINLYVAEQILNERKQFAIEKAGVEARERHLEAMQISRVSARWSKIAGVAAIIAILIALIQIFISIQPNKSKARSGKADINSQTPSGLSSHKDTTLNNSVPQTSIPLPSK